MRAYVGTTGVVFALLVVAHIVRGSQEPHLVRDSFFIIATLVATAVAVWAGMLLRRR